MNQLSEVELARLLPAESALFRSVGTWLKGGWHVAVGYVLGFFFMLMVHGWQPTEKRVKGTAPQPSAASAPASTNLAPALSIVPGRAG